MTAKPPEVQGRRGKGLPLSPYYPTVPASNATVRSGSRLRAVSGARRRNWRKSDSQAE